MDGSADILILTSLLLVMQYLVLSATDRTGALLPWRSVLMVMALAWWLVPILKKAYIDQHFYPSDSIVHEEAAREIAYLIHQGDWQGLSYYFGFGNEGYRIVLGAFYALTNTSEVVTYAIHGCLGFWGMLSILELISSRTSAKQIPLWLVVVTMANPSAMFWCTFNLKEGAMLWGLCMMLQAVAIFNRSGSRTVPLIWPCLGMLVAGFMRPHIAIAYLGGLGIGVAVHQRKVSVAMTMVFGMFAGMAMLRLMAPGFFETIRAIGFGEAMKERFVELSSDGGAAIAYRNGSPTPLISGWILLNFRPFPWEANDGASVIASAEIWAITLTSLIGWLRLESRAQWLRSSFVITLLVAMVALSLYFTYIYNMGLMVRQRVMVYPIIVSLAAIPFVVASNRRVVGRSPAMAGVGRQPAYRVGSPATSLPVFSRRNGLSRNIARGQPMVSPSSRRGGSIRRPAAQWRGRPIRP